MEFQLKNQEKRIKKNKGMHIEYRYKFKGLEEANKVDLKIVSEKDFELSNKQVFDFPFKPIQTKIKTKKKAK